MMKKKCQIFVNVVYFYCIIADNLNNKAFPENFMFGVSTSSYQIEGGFEAEGKGQNIWDTFTKEHPEFIKDRSNGNVACDSYHKYKEDVEMLKDLGVDHYRFSLSWSRILPEGFSNKINEAGVNYYKNLIKELKENNIKPIITIFHWDLPEPLQALGGWTNDLITDWFADYARVCYESFGDDVKHWITLNEPITFCVSGYGAFQNPAAPDVNLTGIGEYLCAHNAIRAHAKAWHVYDDEFRRRQKGEVGIGLVSSWMGPEGTSTLDQVAENKLQFVFGWFGHPLYYGDYPAIMKENIARRSKAQGFPSSRLPKFTKEETEFIKDTVDFVSLNTYTTFLARSRSDPLIEQMGWDQDSEIEMYQPENWEKTELVWLKVTPWGIRYITKWIKDHYNNPRILIAENGMVDNGTLDDDCRQDYLQRYLSNLRDGLEEDGVNVFGYTLWSLMDNFEWSDGYTVHFGLYQVDFNNPNRTRTPKKSVDYFKYVTRTKCIIVDNCVN